MLITNDFVILNYPKTGTTFTRTVLKQLYGDDAREVFGFNPMNPDSVAKSPHLSYSQIPVDYLALPVVSIYRNIFDRYVSQYTFNWWRDHSSSEFKLGAALIFPRFPDLSFFDYLEVLENVEKPRILNNIGLPTTIDVGFQTLQFVIFYAKNPKKCLKAIISNPCIDLKDFMPDIKFLRQEKLRDDLVNFLANTRVADQSRELIAKIPNVNVSRNDMQFDWKNYWPDELLCEYKKREHILISYLLALGIEKSE
jgi:hypothetical protein